MQDDPHSTQPTSQPSVPSASAAAHALPVSIADDARAQRLARRSQLRDEAERDAVDQERRRLESLAAKATAREARRAAVLAAQSAEWRSFGPAQRLFTDGIASCLRFLSLADFNCAAKTCKQWRVGAMKVKRLGPQTLDCPVDGSLVSVRRSPFRGLVTAIADSLFEPSKCKCAEFCMPMQPTHTVARLNLLRWLSNLTSVDLPVDLTQLQVAEPIQYPPLLSTAKFEFTWSRWSGNQFDATSILAGLAACASLTRLELQIAGLPVVLTALGALKQLRHLSVDGFVHLHYTDATLDAIKTLPELETLCLVHYNDRRFYNSTSEFDADWLAPLLTLPHQLQKLQTLDAECLSLWDNEVCLDLLPSLSGLTQLVPFHTSVLALPALAALTNLQVLALNFDSTVDLDWHEGDDGVAAAYNEDGCARLSLLVPHLTHCSSLTELYLTSIACDDESLATLCKSHPVLKALQLQGGALASLQPLGALLQLSHLYLSASAHSDPLPALFEQVCACKSLQQLQLTGIDPPLSEAQQQQLTPPSIVLPLLAWFHYSSREQAEADLAIASTLT